MASIAYIIGHYGHARSQGGRQPAFDRTRGQHFSDFQGFSPGCPLLGALLPRQVFSRSPDRPPAGDGLGLPASSRGGLRKIRNTAFISLHYRWQKYAVPSSREYPICISLIFRLYTIPFLPFNPPCSRTPSLSTAVSSANRAALLMPDY